MAIKMTKKTIQRQKVIKKNLNHKEDSKRATAKNLTLPTGEYIEGIGRRKTAVARVRIYQGQGDCIVNNVLVGEYFRSINNGVKLFHQPFELTGAKGKFAVSAKVTGSGIRSQLHAVLHGMARALVKFNPENKIFLKQSGLLKRDDRMKETRKVGMGGKARRQRQSPKR